MNQYVDLVEYLMAPGDRWQARQCQQHPRKSLEGMPAMEQFAVWHWCLHGITACTEQEKTVSEFLSADSAITSSQSPEAVQRSRAASVSQGLLGDRQR